MITAVNSNNVEKYRALFDEATDILSGYESVQTFDINKAGTYYQKNAANEFILNDNINSLTTFAQALSEGKVYIQWREEPVEGFEPSHGITTLEEYYAWIRQLGQKDRRYTILPLDEPHFIINTETRAIIIPSEFKKNGISVQGDELSEVVYFEVDRFYDYKDLNTADIYIQWELPKGPNGPEVGVSPAYVRDVESKPGKLIFGWALSNQITKNAGTLKFSVRFYDWTDETKTAVGYSLSTLTASVNILPSIGIDITTIKDEQIDDCGGNLINRLENAKVVGGIAAAEPEYIQDLNDTEYDLIGDALVLRVLAQSADTGFMSYSWKKQEVNKDNTISNNITSVESKVEMVEIEKPYNNLPYGSVAIYRLSGSEYIRVHEAPDFITEPDLVLYYAMSTCEATGVGCYYAVASNRITNSVNEKESTKAFFPYPTDVTIATDVVDKYILGKEPAAPALTVELANAIDKGNCVFTYQWYKDNNYTANFGDKAPAWTEIEGAIEASYTPEAQGHYKVVATKTRNKEHTEVTSAICRATNMPVAPMINPVANDTFNDAALTDENCLKIISYMDEEHATESDKLMVTWYVLVDENGQLNVPKAITEPTENMFSFNPANEQYKEKLKEILGSDSIAGGYCAIVTNVFNGEEASSTSDIFSVI